MHDTPGKALEWVADGLPGTVGLYAGRKAGEAVIM
jgi:hypothetical protein